MTTTSALKAHTYSHTPYVGGLKLKPILPEFNQHLQLHVDKNELLGLNSFISGWIKEEHLEHRSEILKERSLAKEVNFLDTDLLHRNSFQRLLDDLGTPDLIELLRIRHNESNEMLRLVSRYPYIKKDLMKAPDLMNTHRLGPELRKLETYRALKYKLGLSPVIDSLTDVYGRITNVPHLFGNGDYAITTSDEKQILYIIETKNTFKALGADFISSVESQYTLALERGHDYAFLIAWPESTAVAEKSLNQEGYDIHRVEDTFRKWKKNGPNCVKVRMPDEVFESPKDVYYDPIGLFRTRMAYIVDRVRRIANGALIRYLNSTSFEVR